MPLVNGILARRWPWLAGMAVILIFALYAALSITRSTLEARTADRDRWRTAHATLERDYRTAQAAAEAQARATEARNAAITKEAQHALETELAAVQADARNAAAMYARQLRAPAPADPRGGGSGVSAPAIPAGSADGAGASAVVDALADDFDACSAAVIKAEGWREWWRAVSVSQ